MRLPRTLVFVFIDEHLPLAAALEAEYPDAVEIREGVEQGRTLYVVLFGARTSNRAGRRVALSP